MARGTGKLCIIVLCLIIAGMPTTVGAQKSRDMQPLGAFSIDRTEVTIRQFSRYAAATGTITEAERGGGGLVYAAAYTERRASPTPPFSQNETYLYPTGETPEGANCLNDCGKTRAIEHSDVLDRGRGHALAGSTRPGVNGLYDMGANVWEWVETGAGSEKGTRGGSWWYGAVQMRADYNATKPWDMAAVYIGFRCAKDMN